MNNLEQPQENMGVDYSMRSKFEAAGLRHSSEKPAPEDTGDSQNTEKESAQNNKQPTSFSKQEEFFGEVVAETIKNIDKFSVENPQRNHKGNGRKANQGALAEAITNAGVPTAEERAETISQYNKKKIAAQKEAEETNARLQEAQKNGQKDAERNWGIRHQKAVDVLEMFNRVDDVIASDSGKEIFDYLQNFSRLRYGKMQDDLREQGATQPSTESSDGHFDLDFSSQTYEKNGNPFDETVPTLTEVADGEPPLNAETPPSTTNQPRATEGGPADMLAPEEKIVGTPIEGQEGAFEKFELLSKETMAGLNPEQLALATMLEKNATETNNAVEERGKKARAMEYVRNVAKTLNKFPPRYSVAVSLGLVATGAIIGSTSITPLMVAGLAMRFVGGMRIFSKVDESLRKRAEAKSGATRTKEESSRHFILAGGLAICIAGLLPEVIRDSVINPALDYANTHHDPISGSPLSHSETPTTPAAHIETPAAPPEISAKLAELSVVHKGEGFWQPVHNQLAALHPDWTPEQLNHETQNLLNKNNIIHPDGSELRVSEVGAHVTLNPDNTISYDHAKTYEANQIFKTELEAVSAPDTTETIPTAEAVPASTLEQGVSSNDVTIDVADRTDFIPTAEVEELSSNIPTKLESLAYAHEYVNNTADELFGSKGFLGFGVVDGTKSPHWLDFANRPAAEILTAQDNMTPSSGGADVGIKNTEALHKMQSGLKMAMDKTGLKPTIEETVEKFLTRAASTMYGK